MILLGISLLFEQGVIGIVFGSIICLFILLVICRMIYYYSKQYFIQQNEKKIENTTENL